MGSDTNNYDGSQCLARAQCFSCLTPFSGAQLRDQRIVHRARPVYSPLMPPKPKTPRKHRIGPQLRVYLSPEDHLGPGKADLLALIGQSGSIVAAGKAMDMSYRRAWLLVETMNRMFKTPLVTKTKGGKGGGGGAELTALGR